jgi:hypothetical protein
MVCYFEVVPFLGCPIVAVAGRILCNKFCVGSDGMCCIAVCLSAVWLVCLYDTQKARMKVRTVPHSDVQVTFSISSGPKQTSSDIILLLIYFQFTWMQWQSLSPAYV